MNQTPVVNFAPCKRTASCEKSTETLNSWTCAFKSLEEVPLSSICNCLEINLRYSFRTWNYNLEPGMRNMENTCWISLHSKPTHSYGVGLTGLSQANMTDVGSVSEAWDWKLCGLRLCSTLGSERALTKEGLKDSNTNGDWDKQQDGWYNVGGGRQKDFCQSKEEGKDCQGQATPTSAALTGEKSTAAKTTDEM